MEVKPGYKQTEVGVIPENWEPTTIGEVSSFSGGSQPPRSTFKFESAPGYIRLIQIRDYKSDDFATFIPESLARKFCTSDDIMIGRYGPPIFQILRGIDGAYNVALIKAIPSAKIDREYFFYVLKQDSLFQLIEALSQRSSGQTGVELPALKGFGLPLPPPAEQRTIASALHDVDALITTLDQLIAKKRDLKQAAMQQLLTGQRRLPGFSTKISPGKLGALFTFRPCKRLTSEDTLVTFLGMEDVSEQGTILQQTVLPMSSVKKGLTTFERHDVLVAKITPCFENGKGVYLGGLSTQIGFGSTEFHVLRATPKSDAQYIYYQTRMQSFRRKLEREMIGTAGQKRVPISAIVKYELPVLHEREEQTAIAKVLSDMDAELAALEQRRDKTRALKQGMMQELLTGRIRLV